MERSIEGGICLLARVRRGDNTKHEMKLEEGECREGQREMDEWQVRERDLANNASWEGLEKEGEELKRRDNESD